MKEIREVSVINKAERRFLKYITEHDNKLEKKMWQVFCELFNETASLFSKSTALFFS